jgi:MFS family permease
VPEQVPLHRNRDFLLLMSGRLLSSGGSQMTIVAYPLLVLAVTGSPAKAGLVGFVRLLALALFSLPAGAAADRWRRKGLMLAADAVRGAAIAWLAVAIAVDRLSYWQVPVVALVEGAAGTVFVAAHAGAFRSIVPARQLTAAANAQQARIAVVQLGAPPLGGALFQIGRALPFLVDAVSYCASLLSIALMRTPFEEARPRDPAPLRRRLGEGLHFLWGQPFLRTTALLWGLSNFTGPGVLLVLVVVGRRQGLTGGEIGALLGVFGGSLVVGSLLGPLVRRVLPVRAILLLEFWCWVLSGAFLLWPSVYVLAAAMVPVGLAIPNSDSVVDGYRLAITPDRLVGRVESVRTTLALSVAPFGPLAAGVLLEHASARATMAVFTLFNVALAVAGTLSTAIRNAPGLDRIDELQTQQA